MLMRLKKKTIPSRVARESLLLCFFSQFYPLTTAEKSIRAPCFALFVSHVMSKIAQELWTVSKWCVSDQKLKDSSRNRSRLAPAEPSCWDPGTRIRESSSSPGPGPSSQMTFACSHMPSLPGYTQGFVTHPALPTPLRCYLDGGHKVADGRPLQLCLSLGSSSLISATAWMPILKQSGSMGGKMGCRKYFILQWDWHSWQSLTQQCSKILVKCDYAFKEQILPVHLNWTCPLLSHRTLPQASLNR